MRKAVVIIALIVSTTSCATPTPAATPTTTTTPAPTVTPAATLTPTATIDPNMPPDATGKDAQGDYTKSENGITVVWNAKLSIWERHLNLDDKGIPFILPTNLGLSAGYKNQVFLYVNIADTVPGFEMLTSISLHPGVNEFPPPGSPNWRPNFSDQFSSDLFVKLNRPRDMFTALAQGASIQFTTLEGQQTWKLGPNTKIVVDILDAPVGNGFRKWWGMYDDPPKYMVRIFTDEQGNLHEWIVPSIAVDQLTKEQLAEIFILAPAQVLGGSDQRYLPFSEHVVNYVQLLTNPAYLPVIDFGAPQ